MEVSKIIINMNTEDKNSNIYHPSYYEAVNPEQVSNETQTNFDDKKKAFNSFYILNIIQLIILYLYLILLLLILYYIH